MSNSWAERSVEDSVCQMKPLVTATFSGADDGIRTRDPHLGKKKVARTGLLTCGVVSMCLVT
jgi:hypothetical protein